MTDPHFVIVAPGWRCAELVEACWASIAGQHPGAYTWEAHLYDDGSDDGTWEAMRRLPDAPGLHRWRGELNMGAAYARHVLIEQVTAPESVVVLLDLDDQLERGALARVAEEYRRHPETWLTYGSWRADRARGRAQERSQRPYPREVLESRSYRRHAFHAAPLRTFRRHLADAVTPGRLQDAGGGWLLSCTDVALMWPLLEQCTPERIRYIDEPLYRYTWRRPNGTIDRFGGEAKRRVRNYLADQPPLPLKAG